MKKLKFKSSGKVPKMLNESSLNPKIKNFRAFKNFNFYTNVEIL